MGPEFDGSFGLYLEYPGLRPFVPGERMHLSCAKIMTIYTGSASSDLAILSTFASGSRP